MKLPCFLVVLCATLCLFASADDQPAKIYRFDSRIEDMADRELNPTRGETMLIQARCLSYGIAMQFTNSSPSVYMVYRPTGLTNAYSISGSVIDATNGQVQVVWRPEHELMPATYSWDLWVSGATSDVVAARGLIRLRSGVEHEATISTNQPIWWIPAPTNQPGTGQSVVWDGFRTYWGNPSASASFGALTGSPNDNTALSSALANAGTYDHGALTNVQGAGVLHVSATETGLIHSAAQSNGRNATTNFAVSVSGGTWDGVFAGLSSTGDVFLSTTPSRGISDFGYTANGTSYDVQPQYLSPTGWADMTGNRLNIAGVTNVRLHISEPVLTPPETIAVVVSNITLHVWGDNSRTGTTNDFGGMIIKVDNAAGTYEPVPLSQMQTAISAAVAGIQPSSWASYPALSVVDCAGQAIMLDDHYRIGIVSNMFSITFQGNNILSVSGGGVSAPAIQSFAVANETGTVVVLGMAGWKPIVEWTGSLVTPAWSNATVISETYPTLSGGTFSVVFSTVTNSPAYYRVTATNLSGSALTVAFSAPLSAPGFVGSGAGLTGITSNSIDAATDAAYRSGGGGVTGGDVTNITTALIKPYTNHQDRVDNPHNTTAAQVGAIPIGGTASNVTTAAIVAAGGRTNDPTLASLGGMSNDAYTASYNLLPIVANGTATITRAMGQSLVIVPTGTVYFAADSSFPTNGDSVFNLNVFWNAQTFGFVSGNMTNTSTLTSNDMNCINFVKPYGETVFRGVKL